MKIPKLLLHHYTSGPGLLGILAGTGALWASDVYSLNDASEVSHAFTLLKSAIHNSFKSDSERLENAVEPINEFLDRYSRSSVHVTCFSAVADSLTQWRGYCPPGFGYSIGFDGDNLREVAAGQGFALEKCIYELTDQNQIAHAFLQSLRQGLYPYTSGSTSLENCLSVCIPILMSQFLLIAPRMKHPSFKNEEEWRLIGRVNTDDDRLQLRPGKSMLVRYLPVQLNLSPTSELLWNICVGPTPHPELAMRPLSHFFRKLQLRNGITRSFVPYRDW